MTARLDVVCVTPADYSDMLCDEPDYENIDLVVALLRDDGFDADFDLVWDLVDALRPEEFQGKFLKDHNTRGMFTMPRYAQSDRDGTVDVSPFMDSYGVSERFRRDWLQERVPAPPARAPDPEPARHIVARPSTGQHGGPMLGRPRADSVVDDDAMAAFLRE